MLTFANGQLVDLTVCHSPQKILSYTCLCFSYCTVDALHKMQIRGQVEKV